MKKLPKIPAKVKRANKSRPELWSDSELAIALKAYFYLLHLELAKVAFSASEVTNCIRNDLLPKRNEASIRYRMRNISWVLSLENVPTLAAYSPASGVGSGVHTRIATILKTQFKKEITTLKQRRFIKSSDKALVLHDLKKLDQALAEVDSPVFGMGHNQPPEELEMPPTEISMLRKDIKNLMAAIKESSDQVKKLKKEQSRLVILGLKLTGWMEARITKATDVLISTVISLSAAKVILPLVISALESLAKFAH